MNASGPHSAEKAELLELAAQHRGAIVFKSCNQAGLEQPDNLKNRGVAHFVGVAGELLPRGKAIVGSVVGESEEEIVKVAKTLDGADTVLRLDVKGIAFGRGLTAMWSASCATVRAPLNFLRKLRWMWPLVCGLSQQLPGTSAAI